MKANWDCKDYRKMRVAPLRFTETDIELIHLGMDGRQKLLASTTLASVR